MTQILKQSTAVDVLIGPFVDITDGATAETGESPSVKLSKNGQTMAAKNDATTPVHDADGYYNCELDATDTGTIGTLVLTVAASANALPVKHTFQVMDATVYDAIYGTAGTFIDNKDLGILVETTISTVNSQTNFDLAAGITLDDTFIGQSVVIEDASTGDFHETYITDCTATGNVIVIAEAPGFTAVASDVVRIYKDRHPTYVISTYDPPTRSELTTDTNSILDKMLAYFQLALRSDAAIATDNSTELTAINADEGSGAGDFDNTVDSTEGLDATSQAIKAKTDQLTFTNANEVDANAKSANDTTILGAGVTANKWRGS